MARSWHRGRVAVPAVLLATAALVGWSHAGASAAATAAASEPAPGTLQALVDAASPGAVVVVPAGVYREEVVVGKSLTLRGDGAEIRGSDVWTEWRSDGSRWRSELAVPPLRGGGVCREPRCAWPEQVFLDGTPLGQVASNPGPGQFSIDADRRIVVADDPDGRQVEVTVRQRWLTIQAPDVTIEGFTMRQVASPPQHGGLQALPGADRLTVRSVRLSDSHGALISFQGVAGASLISSELDRGGQLGVHAGGDGTTDLTIEDTRIEHGNTEGFDPAWEAGGLKAALAINLRLIDNEVGDNDGPGLWCDIDCRDLVASGNRIHGNSGPGIMFEISDGASIEDNVVWENGWGHPTWGWGAGILVSSSTAATVRDNLLAWNADGISVISQRRNRPAGDDVRDTSVTGNTVISDPAAGYFLAWLQDWPGPLFAGGSANTGADNRFWPAGAERSGCHFEWSGCIDHVAAFERTPGGSGSVYLSDDDAVAALEAAGVPAEPIAHTPEELPARTVLVVAGMAGLAALFALAAGLVIRRRRMGRRRAPGLDPPP